MCTPREQPRPPRVSNPVGAVRVENADTVIVAANTAYGEYLKYHAYVCQPDRPFRRDVRWMGFYANEAIQKEVGEILYVWDRVSFSVDEVNRLRQSGDDVHEKLATLIEKLVRDTTRRWNEDFKVFLLAPPTDDRTQKLQREVRNASVDHKGTGRAWTQHQRYTRLDALMSGPRDTDELTRRERGDSI